MTISTGSKSVLLSAKQLAKAAKATAGKPKVSRSGRTNPTKIEDINFTEGDSGDTDAGRQEDAADEEDDTPDHL